MTYALVVAEVILELPLAATLAFCLAYRMKRHKWPLLPSWAIGMSVAFGAASFLLVYYQFQTSQSSPSDTAVGTELTIGSIAGIGALFLASAAAAHTKIREREK